MSDLNTLKTLIDQSFTAVSAKGVTVTGAKRKTLPAKIAEISEGSPALPDLVAGGTYKKTDGTPVVITPISGETTAIRFLVATLGAMKTSLIFTFTGLLSIDWGDGTTAALTSGVAATHQYDGVNGILCGCPHDVYLITVSGTGTIVSAASDTTASNWGGYVGNLISAAIKAPIQGVNGLIRTGTVGAAVVNSMFEDFYCESSLLSGIALLFNNITSVEKIKIIAPTALTYSNVFSTGPSRVEALDMSAAKINATGFSAPTFFAHASSILFNSANTEIGNIDIRLNSLSVAAFVALFNSLPTVTAKTIQIGGSAAALALTAEQIAVATAKGWTVIRTY